MQSIKILLIYTGGTIGMVKDFNTGALKAFKFEQIQQKLPELNQLGCEIETISFEELIDSSDMNPRCWVQIGNIIRDNYERFDGFVVLHGSDTMSYSASALSFMLENLDKPVIFTGSQLPIGNLRTDARENLITSIHLASLRDGDKPVIREVCLYFEYRLFRGNRTTKINAEEFKAFVSMNYPILAESGVHLKVYPENMLKGDSKGKITVWENFCEDVAIIKLFPGISQRVLHQILSTESLRGVVMESFGSGNAPTKEWFLEEIKGAINRGVSVVNVTQCAGGMVIPGKYEAGSYFEKIGVMNGKDLTSEAAITKMMYLLGKGMSGKELKISFEKSLRGEMS